MEKNQVELNKLEEFFRITLLEPGLKVSIKEVKKQKKSGVIYVPQNLIGKKTILITLETS